MGCFYYTSNTINLVAASVGASLRIIEHTILMPDVIDCSAPTHGVTFAKYVAQITQQQGRYAVGHGWSPFVIRSRGRELASLSRCMHRRKVAARRGVLIVQIIDCRNQAFMLIERRSTGNGDISPTTKALTKSLSTVNSKRSNLRVSEIGAAHLWRNQGIYTRTPTPS